MAKIIKNLDTVSHTYAGQVIEASGQYTIQASEQVKWANDDSLMSDIATGKAQVNDGTSDISGINNQINFLKDIDMSVRDADGATILRPKAAKAGWTFFMSPVEFTTAKLNSVYCKKHDDTTRGGITYKIYDTNGTEITATENEGNAVKTVIDFEPSHDYEIIGGHLQQNSKPTTNMRVWVVSVPDVSEGNGGSKEMIGGVNLKFIDPTDKVNADGRVSKYMTYNATYHTNKLRVIIRHDAGVQHDILLVFEMFKA